MLTFANLSQAMYLFHDRISPTVDKNYSLMKRVFKDSKDTLEVVEFIHNNSDKINEGSIQLFLTDTARVDSLKERYMTEYQNIIKTPDHQIDNVINDLKKICYRTLINELSDVSDDPMEYVKRVQEMDWTIGIDDVEHQNIEFADFDSLDPKEISESLGTPIRSRFQFINRSTSIGGYIKNTINLIGGAPAAGKSQFAMDEFLFQLEQGFNCVYVALGDLLKIDFMSRLIAKWYNVSIDYAILHLTELWQKFLEEIKKRNESGQKFGKPKILLVKPDTVTADELYTILDRKGLIRDYDIFWIDYDNNIHSDQDAMFAKGAEIYQKFGYLSRIPNKTVFILSQMKSSTWSKDLLEEEDFGESRRKPEIADLAITISRRNSKNRVGRFNIAKIRRGIKLDTAYFLDISGKFYEIDDATFNSLAQAPHRYTAVSEGGTVDGIEYKQLIINQSNPTAIETVPIPDSRSDAKTNDELEDGSPSDLVSKPETEEANDVASPTGVVDLDALFGDTSKKEEPKAESTDNVGPDDSVQLQPDGTLSGLNMTSPELEKGEMFKGVDEKPDVAGLDLSNQVEAPVASTPTAEEPPVSRDNSDLF